MGIVQVKSPANTSNSRRRIWAESERELQKLTPTWGRRPTFFIDEKSTFIIMGVIMSQMSTHGNGDVDLAALTTHCQIGRSSFRTLRSQKWPSSSVNERRRECPSRSVQVFISLSRGISRMVSEADPFRPYKSARYCVGAWLADSSTNSRPVTYCSTPTLSERKSGKSYAICWSFEPSAWSVLLFGRHFRANCNVCPALGGFRQFVFAKRRS